MAIECRLRGGRLPVIARIADDRVRLDLRSLPPEDDATLVALVREALA
jgi:seryl-tRNA(Sec) selenium transferase